MSRGVYGSTNWAEINRQNREADRQSDACAIGIVPDNECLSPGEIYDIQHYSIEERIQTLNSQYLNNNLNLIVGLPGLIVCLYIAIKLFPLLLQDLLNYESLHDKIKREDAIEQEVLRKRELNK